MLEFRCSHCNALLTAASSTDTITCKFCNTAQPIPDNAMALPDAPAKTTPHSRSNFLSTIDLAPTFPLANILGGLFIFLGFTGIFISMIAFFWHPQFIFGILSCLGTIAIGVILHLLRDIAMTVESIRRG